MSTTITYTPTTTLWRLSIASEKPIMRPEALAVGLRRHLAVARLRAAVVQIGDRQQAYLALDGCPGCAHGRCVEGCRVESLRRTLRAAAGGTIDITLVRSGLSPRPYTRRYALRLLPGFKGAAPALAGEMLRAWPDARLTVAWDGVVKEQATYTACLHLDASGPDPRAIFAELGWQTIQRPLLLGERPSAHLADEFGMLKVINGPVPWAGDPWLLIPTMERSIRAAHVEGAINGSPLIQEETRPAAHAEAAQEEAEGSEVAQQDAQNAVAIRARRARLADHLGPIIAGEAIFVKRGELASVAALAACEASIAGVSKAPAAPQPPRTESIWPKGPGAGKGALWPAVLEAFFSTLLAPASPYHSPDGPGLTYRRTLDALGERHAEHARALIVWLDQAGLLTPPPHPTQPWEGARLLTTHIPVEIAACLRQTPHPAGEELELANRQGLNTRQGSRS